MLKCKKPYTSIDARTLLVTLADVPQAYIASLLTISNKYAGSLHFQAKVDKLYITKGVTLQEYRHSRSRVNSAMVNLAVEFIYDDDNISRLAWEAKKRAPNRDLRWKGLANMFAMRSLVLKHDIATVYRHYLDKQRSVMPGMPPIGKTLFYTIANNITGGGKLQEARAGVDYLKVNFHSENFTIIDKVIDVLAPLSDIDHTLRDELLCLRSDVFTFLSYGFAVHVKSGVQAFDDTVVQSREPQEQEAHQFAEYEKLGELLSQPDLFDEPATQESFIFQVQNQLNMCASIGGSVAELGVNNCCASTHSPAYALDLVPDRRPNMNPKLAGHMDCSACRGTFLFYDRLRRVALSKLDQDPTRLAEIADMLLSIHQCERRTFRYMAHVMLAAQQSHKMKQVIAEMDSSTAYVVFDFKQKFLAKGFREGGDSYYGKKGMLWFGVGVYIKQDSQHASYSESPDKLHVEMDFTADVIRLQQEAEMAESVCDRQDEHVDEQEDEDVQHKDVPDVDALGEDIQDVDALGEDIQDVDALGEDIQDVDALGEDIQDVDALGEDIQDVDALGEDEHDEDEHDEDEHDEDEHDEDEHDEDEHDEDEHDEDVHDEDERDEYVHDEDVHNEDVHDEDVHDEDEHDEDEHDEDVHA